MLLAPISIIHDLPYWSNSKGKSNIQSKDQKQKELLQLMDVVAEVVKRNVKREDPSFRPAPLTSFHLVFA